MTIAYVPDEDMDELTRQGIAYPIVTSDILGILDALEVLHCPPELLAELRKWVASPVLYEVLE